MRVAQLMLIAMSGLALAACKSKPPTLPDASNPPEQSSGQTGQSTDTSVGAGQDANQMLQDAAKQAKDFATADALRQDLAAAGWSMLDRKDGYSLEPLKKP